MQDLRLAPMLDTLRASDRQVFLATNSLWDYTHIVMVRFHLSNCVIQVDVRYNGEGCLCSACMPQTAPSGLMD